MHRQVRSNTRTRSPDMSARDNPQPFSQAIMKEPIPPHFMTPKITPVLEVEDSEGHLKAFQTHMIISGALQNVCGNTHRNDPPMVQWSSR